LAFADHFVNSETQKVVFKENRKTHYHNFCIDRSGGFKLDNLIIC
jgi:hypothetical protein